MITDKQKRHQIIKRINQIPKEKLEELDIYLSKLEDGVLNKNTTLSFAGSWKDIDNSTIDDLTDNLQERRRNNRKRIDE